MDNSIRGEQENGAQQSNGFLVRSLKFFDRMKKWLAGFFEMTQEEQKDAGIYIDEERRE